MPDLQQTLWRSGDDTGAHLCVCGGYGQGKSHTLAYIQAQALQQGYVVSAINLDPREVPLHHFRQTYRALLRSLTFPPTAGTDVVPNVLPGPLAHLVTSAATHGRRPGGVSCRVATGSHAPPVQGGHYSPGLAHA